MNTTTTQKRFIKFSRNWNHKCNCEYFTTIRIASPIYKADVTYGIDIDGVYAYDVRIVDIKEMKLADLPPWTCLLDTGMTKPETIKMFKEMYPDIDFETKTIYVILLKQLDVL